MREHSASLGSRFPAPGARILVLSVLAILTGGCLEIEQEVTIDTSGRGTVRLHYAVEEALIPALATTWRLVTTWQGQETPAGMEVDDLDWMFSRHAAARYFYARDCELVSWTSRTEDGRRFADVELAVRDVFSGLDEPVLGPLQLEPAGERTWLLRADLPALEAGVHGPRRTELEQLLAGTRVTFRLRVPGEVVETDAHRRGPQGDLVWTFTAGGPHSFLDSAPGIRTVFRLPAADE